MRDQDILTAVVLGEGSFTLEEFARACAVDHQWVVLHVEQGMLAGAGAGDAVAGWRFSGHDLWRARRMRAIERDFDAVPELAALVADLLEEVQALRMRLQRAGLD